MRSGDCKHFTGIQNKICKAGISYRELCGGEDLGWARRIPCLARFSVPPTALCSKKITVTEEDEAAWKKEVEAGFRLMSQARAEIIATHKNDGTIACPKCGMTLHFNVAKCNGHVWARCETKECLSWME